MKNIQWKKIYFSNLFGKLNIKGLFIPRNFKIINNYKSFTENIEDIPNNLNSLNIKNKIDELNLNKEKIIEKLNNIQENNILNDLKSIKPEETNNIFFVR